jgi:hypothetical protein
MVTRCQACSQANFQGQALRSHQLRKLPNPRVDDIRASKGVIIARKERVRGGGLKLHLLPRTKIAKSEYLKAFAAIFEGLPEDAPFG